MEVVKYHVDNIMQRAHDLTVQFQDEQDIPERFKPKNRYKKLKYQPDSKIEIRFQELICEWIEVIHFILSRVKDTEQAWRFINHNPKVNNDNVASVTHCQDFLDFMEFLIFIRDVENCAPNIFGKICMLHGAFQKRIEYKLNIVR